MKYSNAQLVKVIEQLTGKIDELERRFYTECRNNQYLYAKLKELENKITMTPDGSKFQIVKPNVSPYFNPNSIW